MTNVFIDTNIFIRILTHDNETLSVKAESIYRKIESGEQNGIVSILVINETLWVLENFYELNRNLYVPALTKLLAFPNYEVTGIFCINQF